MIVVIDGTGPDDEPGRVSRFVSSTAQSLRKGVEATSLGAYLPKAKPTKTYAQEMEGSFCRQIKEKLAGSVYLRGPTLFGSETSAIASLAVDAVVNGVGAAPGIVLAGYSRGGCAAIIAAGRLKAKGLTIDSLFLFDAVDMQGSDMHLSRTIPDNVKFVAHARSARNLGFWAENPIKSRSYFYNTGLYGNGKGVYETSSFVGSHAALGGVPWVDIPADKGCAQQVAVWMNDRLKGRLDVTLKVVGKSV